jgi:putative hemolysin
MSSAIFEIALVIILIVANGIFSGSEIAVVSAKKIRLEQLARRGNRKARKALKLANSPNDFLSTVQIGITLISILSGAFGGATLANRLKLVLDGISPLQPYSETLSFLLVVTLITYLSLVIGELVPKRIALNNPEKIACNVASPMEGLAKITAPIVILLGFSTNNLLKLMGVRETEEPVVTEEEIRVLIEQGTQAGEFEVAEQEMVSRVFRLGDRPIKTLMTPRTSIAWIDANVSLEETQREIMDSSYSRFPVGEDSLDDCIGMLRVKDFLSAHLSGETIDLRAILQPPLFVADSTRVLNVLETFKQSGIHIALVTDEYGGIEGLVTLNDVIESIVGNLPNDDEISEPQVIQREDGSYLLDGLLAIDELKAILGRESLPEEEEGQYQTLGGYVMSYLGKIPTSGDHFEVENLRFEVMDMDGVRVDKVMVSLQGNEMTQADSDDGYGI